LLSPQIIRALKWDEIFLIKRPVMNFWRGNSLSRKEPSIRFERTKRQR